jgi:hypothetical protein
MPEGIANAEALPEEVRLAAEHQLSVELNARSTIYRAFGLALINLTSILEGDAVILNRTVDPLGVALLGFAARGRRVLRSAFRPKRTHGKNWPNRDTRSARERCPRR